MAPQGYAVRMRTSVPIAMRLDARSFPHSVSRLQRRETAISWVVLTGKFAYKIKKPLRLEFLDASSLSRRGLLCEEELRLNRRFAPELYLQVLPISEHHGHPYIGAGRRAVEYCVRMRQFDGSQELARRLEAARVGAAELAAFGERLGVWHQGAAAATTAPYGRAALVRAQMRQNFTALRERLPQRRAARLQELADWTEQTLSRLSGLIEQRRRGGRVRECHGDLHAGNIVCWKGRWVPFDCVEFEPRLRYIDVMSDVAFLFMDLLARRHPKLAYAFLTGYLEQSGDYAGLRLLRLYSVYRALVRAKVDALSGGAASAPAMARTARERRIRARLRGRLTIAARLAAGARPALILMHGVSGSGKSWLSTRLLRSLGAVRVRSDLERRRLLGAGAYSAAATRTIYQRLHDCARDALAGGHRVIVDAAFLEHARRRPFERLALRGGFPLLLIDCHAPRACLIGRMSRRAREAADPSEATPAVLEKQLRGLRALHERERAWLIRIDTSAPRAPERALRAIRQHLRRG